MKLVVFPFLLPSLTLSLMLIGFDREREGHRRGRQWDWNIELEKQVDFMENFAVLEAIPADKEERAVESDTEGIPDSDTITQYFQSVCNLLKDDLDEDFDDSNDIDIDNEPMLVKNVVDSVHNVVRKIQNNNLSNEGIRNIFNGIINGVKSLLPFNNKNTTSTINTIEEYDRLDELEELEELEEMEEMEEMNDGLSYFAGWPSLCKLLWYPYHEERCGKARCVACAPALMASAQVCRMKGGQVTSRCLEQTVGGRFCSFCISSFLR